MREVVALCDKAKRLAAAYFFSTRVPGLDHEQPFVATLVHQMISSIPGIKHIILQRISENDDIFSEALDVQLEKLVIEPLASATSQPATGTETHPFPNVIAVDGFDECVNTRERHHVMRLLYALVSLPRPFFVVLASRPELDIRTAFATRQFKSITRTIELHTYDGDSDIRHYICDECDGIRETHPMKRLIPASWPSEETVDALVTKASGNYIFPSTVVKYISNPRRNPLILLGEVMGLAVLTTGINPLAELDALYTHILHPPDADIPLMRRLLHCLSKLNDKRDTSITHTTSYLDDILQLEAGTTDITFCDLHSVLHIRPLAGFPQENAVGFHHKSLQDFLCKAERSLDLHQPDSDTYIDLVTGYSRHLQKRTRELASGDGLIESAHLASGADFWMNLKPTAQLVEDYYLFLISVIREGASKALPPSVVHWNAARWHTYQHNDIVKPSARDTVHALFVRWISPFCETMPVHLCFVISIRFSVRRHCLGYLASGFA